MTASSTDLRKLVAAARPLIEAALDTTLEMAALRDAATAAGFDWSQIKALLKAQIQDERDDKGRVAKLLAKAETAGIYADMLGLAAEVNEKHFSAPQVTTPLVAADPRDDYLRTTPDLAIPPELERRA